MTGQDRAGLAQGLVMRLRCTGVRLGRGIPAVTDRVEEVHRAGGRLRVLGEDGGELGADLVGGRPRGRRTAGAVGGLAGDGSGEVDDRVVPPAFADRGAAAVAELDRAEVEVAEDRIRCWSPCVVRGGVC